MSKFELWKILALLLCGLPTLAAPEISIARDGSNLLITFGGKLEAAEQITGPWTEITNANGSHSEGFSAKRRFFRARGENDSIFSGLSVLQWTLTGPFQTNFGLAHAGMPDGINPPLRLKPYFDGHFKMGALELPVTMRVRGNSSLQECIFPKLKMKISKENRAGTPFADAREIKIGTHCGEGGQGNIGRLRDERAAWREALAYETMSILGFTSPRVRRVIIEYRDTGLLDDSGGWTVTRHGFIADDIELVAERLGGRALDDEEIGEIRVTPFDPQLITDLKLLHALLGNWDFSVQAENRGIWNTEIVELADKTLLPVAGDFDLASWVTEVVRLSAPREYHPELPEVERQVLYSLEEIRAEAGTERLAAGAERFLQHRAAIEARVQSAQIDEAGRTNAFHHVTAFYAALSTVVNESAGK